MRPIKGFTERQIRHERRAMQDYCVARTLVSCFKPGAADDPTARAILETFVDAGERGDLEGLELYGFARTSRLGMQAATVLGLTWRKRPRNKT